MYFMDGNVVQGVKAGDHGDVAEEALEVLNLLVSPPHLHAHSFFCTSRLATTSDTPTSLSALFEKRS